MLNAARLGCNRSLIYRDMYDLARFPQDSFDFILDLGANVGVFATMSRIKNLQAKIISLEPNKENFQHLQSSVAGLDITTLNAAFGPGTDLWFLAQEKAHSLSHQFIESPVQDSYCVPSRTLQDIFSEYEGAKFNSYHIKFNCEGGEQHLLGDHEAEKILQNAAKISLMVHFPGSRSEFNAYPEWSTYSAWVNDIFHNTHEIHYGHSDRHKGRGVFNAVRRGEGGV